MMNDKNIKEDNSEMNTIDIEERKLLFNAMLEGSKLYDKAIITISAGAYGLSLSIINNFRPITPNSFWYIKCAWYSFGSCIILTLISFFTSNLACSKNMELLENYGKEKNIWSVVNNIINIITLIIFILGFYCLTHFGIINISK